MSDLRMLASILYALDTQRRARGRDLTEMDPATPPIALAARPLPQDSRLRVLFLQIQFDLSDRKSADMPNERESIRRFGRVNLGVRTVSAQLTICRVRGLLESHTLTSPLRDTVRAFALFALVNRYMVRSWCATH
jgi:hypothetical protein